MKKYLLIMAVSALATGALAAKFYKMEGALEGAGDSQEFKIELKSDKVEVDFDWSVYSKFSVRVYDANHEQIAEFNLKDKGIIIIKGGGVFYVEVYSKFGGGPWFARWQDWD
jgi:hypothetical protein